MKTIPVYVAEPETEEVVLYLIAYCLAPFLGTNRTLLLDDADVFAREGN